MFEVLYGFVKIERTVAKNLGSFNFAGDGGALLAGDGRCHFQWLAPLAISGADDGVHLASDGGALLALGATPPIPPVGLAAPPPATAVAISGSSDGVHLASDDGAHLAGDGAALLAVYTLQEHRNRRPVPNIGGNAA